MGGEKTQKRAAEPPGDDNYICIKPAQENKEVAESMIMMVEVLNSRNHDIDGKNAIPVR